MMKCSIAFIQILLFLIVFISCSDKKQEQSNFDLSKIQEVTPQEITRFDRVDSLYFGYLGINSFALDGGNFVLPVWDPASIVKISGDESILIAQTLNGRGPGELLSTGRPAWDGKERVLVYDQFQSKVVIYDLNLNLVDEFIINLEGGWRVIRVFPELEADSYVVEVMPSYLQVGEMDKKRLSVFDVDSEKTKQHLDLFSIPKIPIGNLINERAGSAINLPFGNDQFVTYKTDSNTMLLFDTRTDLIAEVDINFDTLLTIPVNIEKEELLLSEIEAIEIREKEDGMKNSDWLRIKEALPRYKPIALDMKYYDHKIWLKTGLSAEFDKWLVLDMKGEIEKVVNLPKDTYLTHISEHHLGVRLDDSTFGLFEAVD